MKPASPLGSSEESVSCGDAGFFLSADPKVSFKSEGHAAQVAVHEDAVKGFEVELPGTLGAELDDEEV